jgi:hypothetical protein
LITYSTTINESFDVIRLGFVLSSGLGDVLSVVQCPCYIDSAGNRIIQTLFNLGPFIHNETSGTLQVSPNNNLALVATQADIHWALDNKNLPAIDTVDDIDSVFALYKANDDLFYPIYYFYNPLGGNGKYGGGRWNDTSQNAYDIVSGSFTFTQGSNIVTATGIDSTAILDHFFVYLEDDGPDYIVPIQKDGVDTTGGSTTITLRNIYTGSGGTGNCGTVQALPYVPDGKYVKHIAVRLVDQIGTLYMVTGQEVFDSETDAKFGPLPSYPDYVKGFDLKIAYLIGYYGITSWEGQIYDLRPLPFYREGGGGAGGGTVITSHSALNNLDSDDHLQYLRTGWNKKFNRNTKIRFSTNIHR